MGYDTDEWHKDTHFPSSEEHQNLSGESAAEKERKVKRVRKKRKIMRETANEKEWQKLTSDEGSPPVTEFYQFPNYFYAGFWIRFFAFMIDLLAIYSVSEILTQTIFGINKGTTIYTLFALVIYLGYFILFTKITNGQTLGKLIFGIRVVCFKEETLSWQTVLVREGACRLIFKTSFLILGYLAVIFTGKKQHFGDMFADTSVVTLNMIKAYQRLEV